MKVIRRMVGTVEVFVPQDALVEDGVDDLFSAIKESIDDPNPRIVLDMNDVGYADSVSLESLVTIADELGERSQPFKLVGLTPTCREILSLTGLMDRFQYFDSVEAAVRSFL